MSNNYRSIRKTLKKAWRDPVWSKVIAVGIVAVLSSVFVSARSIIENISFKQSWLRTVEFLNDTTPINNSILILMSVVLITLMIWVYQNKNKASYSDFDDNKVFSQKKDEKNPEEQQPNQNSFNGSPVVFFDYRVAKAFPEVRDCNGSLTPMMR